MDHTTHSPASTGDPSNADAATEPLYIFRPNIELAAEAPLDSAAATDSEAGTKGSEKCSWWEHFWFVIFMLFVTAGPLALPLLWKSREFPKWLKVALTVLVVAILIFAGWVIYAMIASSWSSMK